MSTKSRDYLVLEILGPGTTEREWEPRILLAHAICDKVLAAHVGEEIPTEGGVVLPSFLRRLEDEIKQSLPHNCGLDVVLRIDVASGVMALEICAHGRSWYEEARATGADYVRCRACATDDKDTCQPLNGPDDMLCLCGKIREPYDCQSDEWMTKEGGR